jgi:ELWxxDGT repeat protein
MNRRPCWLPLAGACALFAACGPAVEPGEETPTPATGEASVPEEGQVEAFHERPGCACRPPVLATPLTLGDTPTGLRAIFDLNGRPVINVFFNFTTDSALWTLVEREDGGCGSPTWDVVVLKSGLTGFPFPLDIALATERVLYFTASDGVHGNELWKTDGTPEGTVMVADIRPGAGDSLPQGFFALGRTLYFSADDGVHGRELWKSDGTPAGTRLVEDIRPGSESPGIFLDPVSSAVTERTRGSRPGAPRWAYSARRGA